MIDTNFIRALEGLNCNYTKKLEWLKAYGKVVRILEEETNQGDYIFAMSNNAKLYCMKGRRNPI